MTQHSYPNEHRFRITMFLCIASNVVLGGLLLLLPNFLLNTIGLDAVVNVLSLDYSYPPVYARYAGLLLLCVTLFFIPAALSPPQHKINALLTVFVNIIGMVFFCVMVLFGRYNCAYLVLAVYHGFWAAFCGIFLWKAWLAQNW